MTERTFSRPGASLTAKWKGAEAWVAWADSKDQDALDALAVEVKEFLLAEGVTKVFTSVSAVEQRVYERALEFGFQPVEVVMALDLSEV